MKILLYMAMSANGIIAGPHNEEDFLSNYNWTVLCELAKKYGCFIWGRKTYEIVTQWEPEYFTEDIKNAKKIIVSKDSTFRVQNGYQIAKSPIQALDILRTQGFQTVILTGGSTLNSSFAKEKLIDEVLLNVEGVLIGRGIALFASENFQIDLELLSIDRFEENGVSLRYKVRK